MSAAILCSVLSISNVTNKAGISANKEWTKDAPWRAQIWSKKSIVVTKPRNPVWRSKPADVISVRVLCFQANLPLHISFPSAFCLLFLYLTSTYSQVHPWNGRSQVHCRGPSPPGPVTNRRNTYCWSSTRHWRTALGTDVWHSALMYGTRHWWMALGTDVWHSALMHGTRHWCMALGTDEWHSDKVLNHESNSPLSHNGNDDFLRAVTPCKCKQ